MPGRHDRHPLIPAREVDPRQELPGLEQAVLERWRERDVFAQSLRMRAGAPQWVFYEGPPTANGRPGSHHVLSRVFKDIYPRYKTMRGYRVQRKGGWDCHGLPVEIGVEQQLGLTSKADIERYGIERFNAKCRESVFEYLEEWNRLTERIGFWVDLDHAYRTLDESYIESVWWALAEIHRKGLLYEGHKVVPYCPRCGTALSSHEVALGYQDVVDPSVYIKLPLVDSDERLLVWTTTPWTLPGNVAVAVNNNVEYLRVRHRDEVLIVAAPLAKKVFGEDLDVVGSHTGEELSGRRYEGPVFSQTGVEPGGYPVVGAAFVTTEDGTGIVHLAPAFGEDDFNVASTQGLPWRNPVKPDGTYDESVQGYEGRFVKDPALTEELIADLDARGLLLRREDYEHSYPHCWRCGTPLIYYAKPSWYIATSNVRDRMLAANDTVSWHPPHIKHGRFGDWLSNNVDWAISRERYWGTPLPVWRCGAGHMRVIGSFGELEALSGVPLGDHHRPFVDHVHFACVHEGCEQPMTRVPEVIDVWFDSGAMPFAQHHAPFAGTHPAADAQATAGDLTGAGGGPAAAGGGLAAVEGLTAAAGDLAAAAARFARHDERFPADFICEALDQTRGWFYSLLAVSTLLFDTSPYRNVVCLGLILDADGQKMSKSRGNTVEPWQVLDSYGADAFRWYFFTSKQPWDGYRFSEDAIGEGVRLFLKQLWSTYFFYVLYAHANREGLEGLGEAAQGGGPDGLRAAPAGRPGAGAAEQAAGPGQQAAGAGPGGAGARREGAGAGSGGADDLDRWALSRTASTALLVAERLDAYDATGAGRAIAELVDELSNWYVRRSRRRFWDGDPSAFATLRECLLIVSRMLAPFCPFIADEIYDNLDGTLASVHLCDFPVAETQAGLATTGGVGEPGEVGEPGGVGEPDGLPERDPELEEAMAVARETVRLGLGARAQAAIKVRQPLAEAVVVAGGREREAIERMADVVREELNVRRLRFVEGAEQLGEYEIKPNYRTLGPLFGKDMPLAAEAIAALDPGTVVTAVRSDSSDDDGGASSGGGGGGGGGGGLGIAVNGREHTLTAQDLLITMKAPEGYSVEREGAHAVALDLHVDDELLREGRSREIVHAVQNARKTAGLNVEDRIELALAGEAALIEAARAHEPYIAAETLAVSLTLGGGGAATRSESGAGGGGAAVQAGSGAGEGGDTGTLDYREQTEIDGLALEIALSRA